MSKTADHSLPYKIKVGLEIHIELKTQTKMFCRCLNNPFGTEPNTNVCPVCLGLPGALPTPNQEAVRQTIRLGLALGSQIPELSKWDRKHYFYPDLPKGYQISQYDLPFCVGGKIDLLDENGAIGSTVNFERIHLEEDAGKLLHSQKQGYSQVDLNRAGVPLAEMVSKPDLTSAPEARQLLSELQLLARRLGVSDADMEKGQMRCDVNVSILLTPDLAQGGDGKLEINTPVTEIKNVNSTRAVERSIIQEAQRQYDEWMAGGPIRKRKNKLTAGWDEDKERLVIQRAKEAANDYRYMPEPDLPPVEPYKLDLLNPTLLQSTLPELPNVVRSRLFKAGLGSSEVEILVSDFKRLDYFDQLVKHLGQNKAKVAANWLLNAPDCQELSEAATAELIQLAESGAVSFSAIKPQLKEVGKALALNQVKLEEVLKERGLLTVHDSSVVESIIEKVITDNQGVVADYQAGNQKVFGFLVGQVMKQAGGKAQPSLVSDALKQALKPNK